MHFVPALLLVGGLWPLLQGAEPFTWLAGLELLVGASYLVLMRQELRHLRHPTPHLPTIAWLEVAAAGILALEGYHIWHRHHAHDLATGARTWHVLPWLYWGVAGVFVALAFVVPRLLQRRYLQLHETGFGGRLRLLEAPFAFEWAQLRGVVPDGAADVLVHPAAGGTPLRLSFARLHDATAHRDALVAHAHRILAPTA